VTRFAVTGVLERIASAFSVPLGLQPQHPPVDCAKERGTHPVRVELLFFAQSRKDYISENIENEFRYYFVCKYCYFWYLFMYIDCA